MEIQPITVFVVAPPLLGWCVRLALDQAPRHVRFAGSAVDLAGALDAMTRSPAEVALAMVDQEQMAMLGEFCSRSPARVLLATDDLGDDSGLQAALQGGVRGILSLASDPSRMVRAIEEVHDGGLWVDRPTRTGPVRRMPRRQSMDHGASDSPNIAALTLRERQTVAAIVKHTSLPGKLIAEHLSMSEHTLRNHLTSIYAKLGVANRLALYALIVGDKSCAPD